MFVIFSKKECICVLVDLLGNRNQQRDARRELQRDSPAEETKPKFFNSKHETDLMNKFKRQQAKDDTDNSQPNNPELPLANLNIQ